MIYRGNHIIFESKRGANNYYAWIRNIEWNYLRQTGMMTVLVSGHTEA